MKALSVTQPWASVICSGIKDVENRFWQAAQAPGRILIHATKAKVPADWENSLDDYTLSVINARLMGQIPEYKDMPYGSIIGYVDCYDIVRDSESFWAQPESFHWCLRDAYLFDEPIPGVNGVRGHLFEVDIDEENLPAAHKVERLCPVIEGDTLVMPVSEAVKQVIESGQKELSYDMDFFFSQVFLTEKGKLIQPKHVKFICGDKTIEKEVDHLEAQTYLNDEDKPVSYFGFDGADVPLTNLLIVIK